MKEKKIVLIGTGNVATILGRKFAKPGLKIVQIIGRNKENANQLTQEFNCSFADFSKAISVEADLYIFCITDTALTGALPKISKADAVVAHTAATVSKDVLKKVATNYGVFYPLQSLTKQTSVDVEIPILIDGNSDETILSIQKIANLISSKISIANDEQRLKIHTAATIVNNFTNHIFALTEEFCEKEKVDFNLLKPLIFETANRIESIHPSEAQTGPAKRKDILTLEKHLKILSKYPKLKTLYLKLTDSIMNHKSE